MASPGRGRRALNAGRLIGAQPRAMAGTGEAQHAQLALAYDVERQACAPIAFTTDLHVFLVLRPAK